MFFVNLILMVIGFIILGLFWCSTWGRETFAEWFPIVSILDHFVNSTKDWVSVEGVGEFLWGVMFLLVILVPLTILLFGYFMVTEAADGHHTLILYAIACLLTSIGWNLEGIWMILSFIAAGILFSIGLILSVKEQFWLGCIGSLLTVAGIFLLPAVLANLGVVVMTVIGIGVLVLMFYAFKEMLDNGTIFIFWR